MYSVTSGITNCDNSSSSLSQDDASFPHDDQRTLFVGNLSFFCKEEDLRVFFQQYSRIEYLRVLYNRRLRKSLMYGFVTLSTETEAANVLHLLDGHLFMGRKIK
jgi:polyadenylate-binding protein